MLCLLLSSLFAMAAAAQFNPSNPPEPDVPTAKYSFTASVAPDGAGWVNISGSPCAAGGTVYAQANAYSGFVFKQWETPQGEVYSTSRAISYVMPASNVRLVARYAYSPQSPDEPQSPQDLKKVRFVATPSEGGYLSVTSGNYAVGSTVSVYASRYTDYVFVNWTRGDEVLSVSPRLDYQVIDGDNTVRANFRYSPASPDEPVYTDTRYLSVQVSPAGAGSVNRNSGDYIPGVTYEFQASAYSQYRFRNWTDGNGIVLSTSPRLAYEMPGRNSRLTANFEFSPTNPGDPGTVEPTRNLIYGMRQTVRPGSHIFYSVLLQNVDPVTGMNVDITVPEGFTADFSGLLLAPRASGSHTFTCEEVQPGVWRVGVRGAEAFEGGNGAVFMVPMTVSPYAEPGTSVTVPGAKGVVYKADGSQSPVSVTDGILKIAEAEIVLPDSPDLVVSEVGVEAAETSPGQPVTFTWTVANQGNISAEGGWSETLSLVDADGNTSTLGTIFYEGAALGVGESVSRTATMLVPRLPGVDGRLNPRVTVTASAAAGEIPEFRGNNTLIGEGYPITLSKHLKLELSPSYVEGTDKSVRCRLNRSGSWRMAQTFSLSIEGQDGRVRVPASVTIPRSQAGAYFVLDIADNDILDERAVYTLRASGNGYEAVKEVFEVVDNELPSLTMTAEPDIVAEGGRVVFTIEAERAPAADLQVTVSCETPKRFSFPATVVIPAGGTSVTFEAASVDDAVPDIDREIAFSAIAPGYTPGAESVKVTDNDMPTLSIALSPVEVAENAGPLGVSAVVSRVTNVDKEVTIEFGDDSEGALYFPARRVTIPAGVAERTFNFGPVDNTLVDGERDYTISAAVYIPSCGCAASSPKSGGVVTARLKVIDDDGPALTLTSASSVMREGGEAVMTVKRNTPSAQALDVTLSGSPEGIVELPGAVTIPAGSSSASFTVKAPRNQTAGDSANASVTATAPGFAKGCVWFTVSDQSLPDARVESVSIVDDAPVAGQDVTLRLVVANEGFATLPAQTPIALYISGETDKAATAYLQQPVAEGERGEVLKKFTLPAAVGGLRMYAVINPGRDIAELSYTNNTSPMLETTLLSPYGSTVSVDRKIASRGETVRITGRITGKDTASKPVEVYVVNNGYRHVIEVTTDAQGAFATDYTPFERQAGHFSVGACSPGENATDEKDSFDIYGMSVGGRAYDTHQVTVGDQTTGTFTLVNSGPLPLTSLKVRSVSDPGHFSVTADAPDAILGDATVTVRYTLEATAPSEGADWEVVRLIAESAEGAVATFDVYGFARVRTGRLESGINRIDTKMTYGVPREYPLTISNAGAGETGAITLSLPSWMQSVTPATLASLAPGESTQVVLRFMPFESMQLNVPVTGKIGLNCANGDGLSMPYSVEPVSEVKGTLTVDVCDQYTYYTAEAPHVAGAEVTLSHPTTGAVVARGVTGADGTFTAEVNEGYYRLSVTAEKHDQWADNILVDPGANVRTVNLDYNAISYSFTVEETTVEDTYEIRTTVTYETNVPKPVVVLKVPERIDGDNMALGETLVVYFTVTNKGMMTAFDCRLRMPQDNPEWKFEALEHDGPFDLAASQTIVIPVAITRISINGEVPAGAPAYVRNAHAAKKPVRETNIGQNFMNCMTAHELPYKALCDKELKDDDALANMTMKMCALAATGQSLFDLMSDAMNALGVYPGGPGGGPGGGGGGVPNGSSTDNTPVETGQMTNLCDTCDTKKAKAMVDFLLNEIPVVGLINDILNDTADTAIEARKAKKKGHRYRMSLEFFKKFCERIMKMNDDAKKEAKRKQALGEAGAKAWGYVEKSIEIIKITSEECPPNKGGGDEGGGDEGGGDKSRSREKSPTRDWQVNYDNAAARFVEYASHVNDATLALYGDHAWLEGNMGCKKEFFETLLANPDMTVEEAVAVKPEDISAEQVEALLERLRNFDEDIADTGNSIDLDVLDSCVSQAKAIDEEAVSDGFLSMSERFEKAFDACMEGFANVSESVCASVTLRFDQTMTMTRQAFRGTLTVYNGHESLPMRDVRLNINVKDEEGNLMTSHEFQISPESMEGFEGALSLADGWTLAASSTGTARILFIPTRYAAPDQDRLYKFGGSFSYIDPFTGLEVTRTLSPVTLTVKPSPVLDLTYFMQRDVLGDDPHTEGIEPSIDAEFALLVNNIGYGDAADVRMVTAQPVITDNEKGLQIDFELMSSLLNGRDKTLALGGSVTTEFGDIPARSQAYAQWAIRSSLLGHFTDYNVEATHVSSYGNPDLSLLNSVNIHELIRSLEYGEGESRLTGFMTNDISDIADTPDMLYWTDGTVEPVAQAVSASIAEAGENIWTLTVSPQESGWNYGSIEDPTSGRSVLVSVADADGRSLSLRNFWQTDRTLRDGQDPLYENRLHFADLFASVQPGSYTLVFEPRPELELAVESMDGIPADDMPAFEPVNTIAVTFNKTVRPDTFTPDDLTLTHQGVKLDTSAVGITTTDARTFTLDLSGAGVSANGYYSLTVRTDDVTDSEGFKGYLGANRGWTLVNGGLIRLETEVYPEDSGAVLIESTDARGDRVRVRETPQGASSVDYGSTVSFSPVAEEGYDFVAWERGGERISTDVPLILTADDDIDVTARFRKKTFTVGIAADPTRGTVAGAAQGVYEYGTTLTLTPEPAADYDFASWTIDGEAAGSEGTLTLTVTSDISVEALFDLAVFEQRTLLSRGWNWISSRFDTTLPLAELSWHSSAILAEGNVDAEAFEPGRSYKVKSPGMVVALFSGRGFDFEANPIRMKAGWNWVAYPFDTERGLDDIVSPEEGDVIAGQFGFAEYGDGFWQGSLAGLVPGEGYLYRSASERKLEFSDDSSNLVSAVSESELPTLEGRSVDAFAYPGTMNFVAQVSEGDNAGVLSGGGCDVFAMCGDELRGAGVNTGDLHYLTAYGDPGDEISFLIRVNADGKYYTAREKVPLREDVSGSRRTPFVLTMHQYVGTEGISDDGLLGYPVPVYTVTGILIDAAADAEAIRQLPAGVYIVGGRKYVVK